MTYNLDQVLRFLTAIKKNNNREWFEKNKDTYLQAKNNFDDFLAALHEKLITLDPKLASLNPRKLAFRIYRDVRFSKDKSPYKVNMGAGFSPKGKMADEPGYYLHLEPGNCFVAVGLYKPSSKTLAKIRQEIDYNGDKLKKVLKQAAFKRDFGALGDFDMLKKAPKGYAPDHPDIELLRYKSYIVSHYFTNTEVKAADFVKTVITLCRRGKPLHDFLSEAIS